MTNYKNKTIIGLVEKIELYNKKGSMTLLARIDTGATKSSIDARLAAELQLGPVIQRKLIKSAHGNKIRPIMEAKIRLARKIITSEFTIADRNHMKYHVLIGQNILKQGYLIDPGKGK